MTDHSQPARALHPVAKAQTLTHLIFERPDLDTAEEFLTELGLRIVQRTPQTLYARGTEASAYCYRVQLARQSRFVGLGLSVATHSELAALCQHAGGAAIAPVNHPGGGLCLRLTDPAGFVVEVLHGQELSEALTVREPLAMNTPTAQVRLNAGQRPEVSPPDVVRLGHVVLEVASFQRVARWYTELLGFLPSDVQLLPDGSPLVAFLRLDLGAVPADHHTLALAQSFANAYSHSAYELVDPDAVGMGHRVLHEAGYRHAWGIGRHILGSQIFDYWYDPWGDKHEHYCDGDLFTSDVPAQTHPASRTSMAQWGPPMPRTFTRPHLSLDACVQLVTHLRKEPDLSVAKLITLAKLFA
jgi:catechol 2,3-dioxygenase-like lactoylglutathione lyase family enzyme